MRECVNCKYSKGTGSDVYCGHNPKGNETYMSETDCPYFRWIERISEKRYYVNSALYLCDNDLSNTLSIFECADLLNQLTKENEQLRKELSECEKFRYSSFKRIEKTIEDMDNCVLNKDAKSPCKDYDECLKRQCTTEPLPCIVNWMMGRPFEDMLRKED